MNNLWNDGVPSAAKPNLFKLPSEGVPSYPHTPANHSRLFVDIFEPRQPSVKQSDELLLEQEAVRLGKELSSGQFAEFNNPQTILNLISRVTVAQKQVEKKEDIHQKSKFHGLLKKVIADGLLSLYLLNMSMIDCRILRSDIKSLESRLEKEFPESERLEKFRSSLAFSEGPVFFAACQRITMSSLEYVKTRKIIRIEFVSILGFYMDELRSYFWGGSKVARYLIEDFISYCKLAFGDYVSIAGDAEKYRREYSGGDKAFRQVRIILKVIEDKCLPNYDSEDSITDNYAKYVTLGLLTEKYFITLSRQTQANGEEMKHVLQTLKKYYNLVFFHGCDDNIFNPSREMRCDFYQKSLLPAYRI